MSQSNNHQSNTASEEKVLYDKFLKSLPQDDGASSPFNIMEAIQSCQINTCSGSTDPSNKGEGGESQEVSDASLSLTLEQQKQFLEKIYEPVKRDKVYGFDYDEKSLKMLLLNERSQDSFKLIGVVGMVGVGKTTLCRLIFNEEEVKQRFVPRLWIPRSESKELRSMEKVVERMLEHLGVEEEIIKFISNDHKLPGLLYALHLQLKGKKFFIVFDDVQEQDEYYEKLKSCLSDGHGFPKGYGGAVILTSRNEEAIKTIIGEQNLYRLLPLSDPENCWEIYQTLALGEDGVHIYPRPTASPEVQEELKKKCGGLPIVARIMGELKRREKNQSSNQPSKTSEDDSKHDSSQAATTST